MDGTDDGPGETLGTAARARAVAEIRGHLRQGDAGEDMLIGALAESAAGIAELFLGTRLIRRAMRETVAAGGRWTPLAARPVRAILAVEAAGGVALPIGRHAVDIAGDGTGWVRAVADAPVTVRLEAGEADGWDGVPPAIRQGIVLLAAHLFIAREGDATPPGAVAALWRPYRRLSLMAVRR